MKKEVSTLFEHPHLYREVIKLIEDGFNYPANHSFEVDFSPLMNQNNWKNCHILLIDGKLAGHIGAKLRSFKGQGKSFETVFFGGIVISRTFRGMGLYTDFFNQVLDFYQHIKIQMLWSDLTNLYNRFNFFEKGSFHFYTGEFKEEELVELGYLKTSVSELNDDDREVMMSLYNDGHHAYIQPTREDIQWNEIFNVTSTTLWVRRHDDGKIHSYLFAGKGADLDGIIHELYPLKYHQEIKTLPIWTPMVIAGRKGHIKMFLSFFKGDEEIQNLIPKMWVCGLDSV